MEKCIVLNEENQFLRSVQNLKKEIISLCSVLLFGGQFYSLKQRCKKTFSGILKLKERAMRNTDDNVFKHGRFCRGVVFT